jgi:hypothetical protein
MKKVMFLLGAFVLMGSYGFAQTSGDKDSKGDAASVHGSTVSSLAHSTTVKGKQRGSLISSAARAKALLMANANAKFIRGDAKPSNANSSSTNVNANTSANVNATANSNGPANANANGIANANVNSVLSGTASQSVTAHVGKPVSVPIAVQGMAHAGVH